MTKRAGKPPRNGGGNGVVRVRPSDPPEGFDIDKAFDAGAKLRQVLADATPVPDAPMMTATVITAAGIITFGGALLRTNDLDPAYVALWGAELPLPQLKRLLLAYCLFYHLGLAAYLVNSMAMSIGTECWWRRRTVFRLVSTDCRASAGRAAVNDGTSEDGSPFTPLGQ